MIFLSVTLLTFVQFLWVLLWIGITLVIFSVLAGFYLYYRKNKMNGAEDPLSPENEIAMSTGKETAQTSTGGEKAYQGLLWLKGKYEEDIEQADTKFYELREEFKKLEKKYIDLRVHSIHLEQQLHSFQDSLPAAEFTSMSAALEGLAPTQEQHSSRQDRDASLQDHRGELTLDESSSISGDFPDDITNKELQAESIVVKQAEWDSLHDKLVAETLKAKDLESRLASSSQLLMKMYKELTISLQASNTFYKSKAQENRVKGLVKEFDAAAASTGGSGERKISSWVESPAVDEDGQLGSLG